MPSSPRFFMDDMKLPCWKFSEITALLPAGLLLYKSPTGQPVGLCIRDWGQGALQMQTSQRKGTNTVYWADDQSIFVLLGWTGPALLWDLMPEVQRSMEITEATGKT